MGWWVPPLGWKGRCDSSGRGLGRYRDLYRVASGWGGLVGAPLRAGRGVVIAQEVC